MANSNLPTKGALLAELALKLCKLALVTEVIDQSIIAHLLSIFELLGEATVLDRAGVNLVVGTLGCAVIDVVLIAIDFEIGAWNVTFLYLLMA